MNELKKWGGALMLAAMISVTGCALPVQAAPEATLDSFVPGAGVETLAPLKLKAQGADKALKGGVVWDGYKLAAVVRTEQGKIRDASLKGALDNGLMGMILSAMEEKGFVPAVADNDGAVAILLDKTAEQSREAAVEAMGSWAGDGKKALKLLYKSNPTLAEWLTSPEVYIETEYAERLRELARIYYFKKGALYHYASMAEGNYRENLLGDQVKLKKMMSAT